MGPTILKASSATSPLIPARRTTPLPIWKPPCAVRTRALPIPAIPSSTAPMPWWTVPGTRALICCSPPTTTAWTPPLWATSAHWRWCGKRVWQPWAPISHRKKKSGPYWTSTESKSASCASAIPTASRRTATRCSTTTRCRSRAYSATSPMTSCRNSTPWPRPIWTK